LPADALAATACGAGQDRIAPSLAPAAMTAPQSIRRGAPIGYSPSKARELDQLAAVAGTRANPHAAVGDTIGVRSRIDLPTTSPKR